MSGGVLIYIRIKWIDRNIYWIFHIRPGTENKGDSIFSITRVEKNYIIDDGKM